MTLAHFLNGRRAEDPPPGVVGVESDWLAFCKLPVTTGLLWVGDAHNVRLNEGCVVEVGSGSYVVEAKCMDFSGPTLVSRLRIRSATIDRPKLGQEVGEVSVDSPPLGVCDIRAFDAVVGSFTDLAKRQIVEQTRGSHGVAHVRVNGVAHIPFVATGRPDGAPTVYELTFDRACVGLEIELIQPRFAAA